MSTESRGDRNRILDRGYRRRLGIARQRDQDIFERHEYLALSKLDPQGFRPLIHLNAV